MTNWNDPQGRRPQGWEVDPTQQYQRAPQGQRPPQGQPQYGYQNDPRYQGQQGGQNRQINPFGAESNEAFGIVGTVCALLGFVVLLVAFSALDWFTNGLSFSDVHHGLQANSGSAATFASAWFSWLAWTFAIVGTLAAVGSCFPSPAVRALRIVGVVIGVAAAGLAFLAIQLDDSGAYSDYIKHARAGFYVAVIGFLLLAVGAAVGTRKV